jgi:acetyl esterase/lipase
MPYYDHYVVYLIFSYRLNPEHSQRAGLDDCLTATKYLIKNGDKYGVDPERVVIAGTQNMNYALRNHIYI